MKYKLIASIAFLSVFCTSQAFAHGGGVDDQGCHSKNQVRHCHGANAGKYIPEKESSRVAKLHSVTCNSADGEGRFPKRDLYGRRCNDVRGR